MKRHLIILFSLIPMLLMAQVQNPLIPSKRNDRLLQEQAEREAQDKAQREARAAAGDDSALTEPQDSAIIAPTQVRQLGADNYEQLTLSRSSMDLADPSNVATTVEYDPVTGGYVMHTRIGDTEITTPYYMTADEYQQYSERQLMHSYWQKKIGEVEHNNERKFDITDMKFDIGPADKVFGPGGVQLKMQGSAELLFGFKHQYIGNPALTQKARNNNIFDFDEKIQASVTGKVGDKLDFKLNYNTEASFSFDQQNLKLAYKGKEDDIIQSIEMGNVTMDLNSSLIQGAQALFGAKTKLKFGKLSIQAVVTQQNSESQNVSSQGGAQTTPYEVGIENYDENRHFFLGYFFRDRFESAMKTLPYVASGVTINKIEVWVTNKRGNYDNSRNLLALVDLGEAPQHILDQADWKRDTIGDMPRNQTNSIYRTLIAQNGIRDIREISSIMQNYPNMDGGDDYEKIESARLLNSSEYTLNSALGYISLKSALQQDEVLAVAYEYTYQGQVYQVGEFSTDGGEVLRAPNALIVKLLKATATAPTPGRIPHVWEAGTWDLMMKNIYAIGSANLSNEKFELNVMYRNDSVGTNVQYLDEGACKGKPLLRVLGLDRLDSRNNQFSDGKFDFVPGYTVLTNNGRIIFPVLEPFGEALRIAIADDEIAKKYTFQELYDSTLVVAQEMTEKNKFMLKGRYAGSSGNEINLNAMNIPRGSVIVTAGGATLIENVDYTVDYTMGRVTILNESILESGTAVNVKLENQSTFSMTRKGLYGLHLDYEFNKDFIIGGTLMHMREQALTTKVNQGNEPKANTIWGVNLAYKTDLPWLTSALDRIPWMDVKAPSSFAINAEFAQLIPGHTRDVGKAGTSYIDDFESTKTAIDVHFPTYWFLSSTPSRFSEYNSKDVDYGKNRALLAWYYVDPIFGYPQSNTPEHLRHDANALSDHRTRIVYEQELYPNKEQLASEDTRLSVLNMSFYPEERGPYNICASQINAQGKLINPKTKWGGMMRRLDNTDFEKANVEYIEFWLMDPALTNDGDYNATLYIDLGDISEDILRDGKKSFENGLPTNDNDTTLTEKTIWGRVPKTNSTVTAFSNEAGSRIRQDVGLNGLNDEQEYAFEYNGRRPYKEYVDSLMMIVNDSVKNAWNAPTERFSPIQDPAGDNFHYYRGSDFDNEQRSVLYRYKHYNGTQGNSPDTESQTESYGTASTLNPDVEDINRDNTLSENEKYYEYEVRLNKNDLRAGNQYITEVLKTNVTLRNGEKTEVTWYQFKIPIKSGTNINSMRNFKSIRFMRMYLTNCEKEFHMRMGTLDLVRGEWRQYNKPLYEVKDQDKIQTNALLDVQAVNIEENSARRPINYVLPPGVSRQTDPGQAQLIAQNEQAMVLRVHDLSPKDARAVYKGTSYDMRNYKRLQMFVHAEELDTIGSDLQNGDLSCYIRMGSDLKGNYYEYEIPLSLTAPGSYNNNSEADRLKVWPEANYFDFPFTVFTNAKSQRNKDKRAGNTNVGNNIPYVVYDDENGKSQNRITVMGNPTLENIEYMMIGVRNRSTHVTSGEIWVNELRLNEFNEQGGVAAMANASLAISDIAQVNFSGRIETAGFGSIESNVMSRNMEDRYQMAVSAAVELGRFFPEKAKMQIPVYVSYQNETTSPLYDPLDTDIKFKDNLENYETKEEKDSIKMMARTTQEATSFSVTNLKVNIHSKKRDMFYDPANFSISTSFNQQKQHSPEIERDETTDHRGSFQYAYSFNPQPWEPFKNAQKVQKVKFLKELNFYYLPQSWAFNTNMHRQFSQTLQRDLTNTAGSRSDLLTYSKDFTWDRNFDFKYDLTKNMKFTFQTAMNSTVDEGRYAREIIKEFDDEFMTDRYQAWKDTIQRSLAKWGTPYTYQQVFTASWNVPFNRIPYLEAITANASYNATYNWARTQQSGSEEHSLGNNISSLQSWQVDGGINFETLYGKSNYWKTMTQRYTGRQRQRPFKAKSYSETVKVKKGEPVTVTHRLASTMLQVVATDSTGRKIAVTSKPDGNNKIIVTSREDCNALTIAISTKDPNERTPAQVAGDMFAYVGTMVRRLQVTYRRTNSMTVPGFNKQAGFMGQSYGGGAAPGFDFAFGFIADDWINRAKDRGWLSGDSTVVQPATRARTEDLDIKLTLEPLPGFKVQLTGKRYFANSTSIIYNYDHLQENMTGSFNITQVAIGTAFQRISGVDQNFASETFTQFLNNRTIMQERVQERYNNTAYPKQGFLNGKNYAGMPYSDKFGKVQQNSADVLVPAFLSAYTGRDVNKIGFDPFLSILKILPNWSVTYDGLGKLPWMKDHFRSVTLTHAYTCKYSIGSYNSYSTWVSADGSDKTLGFVRDVTTGDPLPSSAYDITNVTLSETFSPLVGLNMTMKNSLSFKSEYRKQRNLALNVTSVQITEGHTDEFVLGAGYTIKNLNFNIKNKNGAPKKVSNDLKLNVDISYKNIKTLLRKVEEQVTQASNGNKVFAIKIAADYVLSSKVNLQLYYDHQTTTPLISTSYPTKADNIGLNIKLMLTR